MSVQTVSELGLLENIALHYRDEGKLAQALPVYVQAASLAETDDTDEAARLWSNAGVCALKVFDPDHAVECFRNAIDLATVDHTDRQGRLARLYANLTAAYYQGSRIREAWDAGRQALLLAEESKNPRAIGAALFNLGLAERYLGDFDEALKLFAAARRQYLKAGAASEAADALHNTGWVHLDRQELQEAEEVLRQAREEKRALGEPTARIDVELARLSLLRDNWIGALNAVLHVAETAEALTDPMTRTQALLVAAEAAQHDSLTPALHYAETALALALGLGYPPILLDIMPLLIRLRNAADLPHSERERDLATDLYARRHGVHARRGSHVEVQLH